MGFSMVYFYSYLCGNILFLMLCSDRIFSRYFIEEQKWFELIWDDCISLNGILALQPLSVAQKDLSGVRCTEAHSPLLSTLKVLWILASRWKGEGLATNWTSAQGCPHVRYILIAGNLAVPQASYKPSGVTQSGAGGWHIHTSITERNGKALQYVAMRMELWIQMAFIWILASWFPSCVTSGRLLNLFLRCLICKMEKTTLSISLDCCKEYYMS